MSPEGSSRAASDAAPDEQTMTLALALANSLLAYTRDEGRYTLQLFTSACTSEMGGTLIVKAPSGREKRRVTEVRFASEGIIFTPGFAV